MLTPTHLLVAQTSYLAACVVAAHPPAPEEAAVALLGALLPDLDSRAAYSEPVAARVMLSRHSRTHVRSRNTGCT